MAVLYAFDEPEAQKTGQMVRALGREELVIFADVRHKDQVEKAVGSVVHQFGRLDIMVNSAGTYQYAPFLKINEEDSNMVIDINLKGAFNCGQAAGRAMLALGTPGRILIISSTQADRPLVGTAHYGASKSGMLSLVKAMALELAEYRIGVVLVCPGVIESAGNLLKLRDPGVRREVESQIPWGRVGQPRDVANLLAFLASDEAEYITGVSITIDGGLLTAGPQA